MTITSIERDWGPNVSIVRMVTPDQFIEQIISTGWLTSQMASIAEANHGPFSFEETDLILISYPQDQDNPVDGVQAKSLLYVFPSFNSLNPISPIYPNLQNITAHAGGGQANAVQLNIGINVVTVCATANDSVKLPTDVLGQTVIVPNRGAASLRVFPAVGDSIDGLGANVGFDIAPGQNTMFIGAGTTNWQTIS